MASVARRTDRAGWRARYRDEAGREHSRTFPRKIDATKWLAEQSAAIVTGQWVDPNAGSVTFAAFYASWAPRQATWAPRTREAMDLAVKYVPFADEPLGHLRRSHVEAWVKAMITAGLAPRTVRLRVANVRSVLRAAVRDRIIVADPAEGVPLPRIPRAEVGMRLPTSDEVGAVLGACEGSFRGFVAVCAFAGLRLGEAAGLQGRDVDFLRRQLAVQRQVQRVPGDRAAVNPPKHGSERMVPAPDALLEVLAPLVQPGTDAFLFRRPNGELYNDNAAGLVFRRACAAAGVTGLTLHDCRHFYASGLIAAGCDVVTVQRALGHHAASVTLNVYSHLWPSGTDRTRRAAEALAVAALGRPAAHLRPVDAQ